MGADAAQSFKKRAKEIADLASHSGGTTLGEGAEFLRGLDEEERKRGSSLVLVQATDGAVFRVAHDDSKAVRSWIAQEKA